MGAYDNPRIIQPPDYTEIFMKNFAAGQAVFAKAFEGVKRKKKERETKLDKAYQDTSTIRVKGNAINAGDMTANVRKQANLISDDFYAYELAYIDEKIDRQTYQSNRDKHLGKLQGMVDIGGELGKIDLSNIKISRHQKDKGYSLGLIESYNNGAVDIDYSGDLAKLYYMDPNNNRVEVDLNVLKNIKPEDFGINEVYEFDDKTTKSLIENTFNHTKQMNTVTVTDGAETIKMQVYQDGEYKTKEDVLNANKIYEENIINAISGKLNNFYNNLGSEDRGSLFADRTFASYTMGKNENNTFQPGQENILNNVLSKIDGITDEDIKHVKEQILNGTYNGTDEQLAIMDEVSKDSIAHQLFNSSAVPKAANQSVVKSQEQIEKEQKAQKLQDLSIERAEKALEKEQNKPNKPIVDYTELTYGDVTTNSRANNIREFLITYDDLNLNQAKTPQQLIVMLKNLDKNDLGIQSGDNPYKNYKTVKEIKNMINSEEGIKNFTSSTSSVKRRINSDFLEKINSLPEDSYVNLGTVTVKGKPYFYAGSYWNETEENSTRKSRFQDISGDNAGQIVDILKGFDGFGVTKFRNVDPDVLISEIRLFLDNPRRFK
jgi:hypothetical protein